jgi:hypothetical protein
MYPKANSAAWHLGTAPEAGGPTRHIYATATDDSPERMAQLPAAGR